MKVVSGGGGSRLFTVEEVRVNRFFVGRQVHQKAAAAPCLRHTAVQAS